MTNDLNIMVAGAAGQGLQTIGFVLAKIFVRGGCRVFAGQEIQSRIRGGHNTFQLRVSENPVRTLAAPLDILVALDQQSVDKHIDEVHDKGIIIFDSENGRPGRGIPVSLGFHWSDWPWNTAAGRSSAIPPPWAASWPFWIGTLTSWKNFSSSIIKASPTRPRATPRRPGRV